MSVEVKAQDELALASIKSIYDAASRSQLMLEQMEEAAESANTTLTGIYENANSAQAAADEANLQAIEAANSANAAQYGLSEVEKVVDVINWIAEHGEYVPAAETSVIDGKYYFSYDSATNTYTHVSPPPGANPAALGLYALDSVDASISNYVASHVSLDDNGLVIQTDGVSSKVRVSGNGVILTNEVGDTIATFSEAITLGDANSVHVVLSAGALEFWNGASKVSWVSTDTLHIEKAEIEKRLRIGKFVWKVQSASRISLVYEP